MKALQYAVGGLFAASVLVSGTVGAASHCKGLSESVCSDDSSCRWVAGYVRKDGREVSAHCRLGKIGQKTVGTQGVDKKLSAVD